MPSYNSTARVPFKTGGSVKKPKVKRIILWKGKAKDWPGAKEAARQTRNRKAKGGKVKDVNKPTSLDWFLLHQTSPAKRSKKAKGGKADKNWIQGVNKSIKKRGTKGVCTGKKFGSASCKPCSRRYNLAKTFKKMARAKHASGGLVRYI